MNSFTDIMLQQGHYSFLSQTQQTPEFDTRQHFHKEYELIMIIEGKGTVQIGNYEGPFQKGDIYFIGSNLTHRFNTNNHPICTCLIHFSKYLLGNDFFNTRECSDLQQLLQASNNGLLITGKTKHRLPTLLTGIIPSCGITRVILLLQCLQMIAKNKDYISLISRGSGNFLNSHNDSFNKVLTFTLTHFQDPLSLKQIANVACMSIPSFCNYFKRHTQKSYFDFLNEVRVSYACNQLQRTEKTVSEIGYESGYNTIVHFHRQFLKLKKITPLKYRKLFLSSPAIQYMEGY